MNFGKLYDFIMENVEDEEYQLQDGEEAFDVLELSEDEFEKMEFIDEALKRTVVIRKGVRTIEVTSDRPGYKVVRKGSTAKEVKLGTKEANKREKAQLKGSMKRKATQSLSQKKRQVSIKKRGV